MGPLGFTPGIVLIVQALDDIITSCGVVLGGILCVNYLR